MPYAPPRHNAHKVKQNRLISQKEYNATRRTGQEFYNSIQWRRLRNWYIRQHPLCAACKKDGLIVNAKIVDHVIPVKDGGDKLNETNLQSLCTFHHNQKTAREESGDRGGVKC
jgi:5-methylcytosine-specific restriction protein A